MTHEEVRARVEAELDPEWVAKYGDWSWAAAMALFGETSPTEGPPESKERPPEPPATPTSKASPA